MEYVADFETTVYPNQQDTEVWASAVCEIGTENVKIFNSIDETYKWIVSLRKKSTFYYHNLKFDGTFWLYFLMIKKKYRLGLDFNGKRKPPHKLQSHEMSYLISDRGQYYNIAFCHRGTVYTFKDSLKMLPFSVDVIGKSFDTRHKKLQMNYVGFRYAGCEISKEEKEYIKNDVLVMSEALEIYKKIGGSKSTIGSSCMNFYKKTCDKWLEEMLFIDLKNYVLDKDVWGGENADVYIRKSYKGGWCYLKEGYESKIVGAGFTVDHNSLYPSKMHSESGNLYPVGNPTFEKGKPPFLDNKDMIESRYYFVRFKCEFNLKEGYLPFVQIKGNYLYDGTENLTTSKIKDKDTGCYIKSVLLAGKTYTSTVELTMTHTELVRFLEHYNVTNLQWLDYCWFYSEKGLFDEYINYWKKIKENNTGAIRTLAKLFLNNLYGKFATSEDSSYKLVYFDEYEIMHYNSVMEKEKDTVNIAIGSAITSYARECEIRTAQANYDIFVYADTDSLHCLGKKEDLIDTPLHDTKFNHWKVESEWDFAKFVRQKTYIEHFKNGEYNVICAGMPKKCKELFIDGITGRRREGYNYTENDLKCLEKIKTINDFDIGLKLTGKLIPKRIKGGTILVDTTYEMR